MWESHKTPNFLGEAKKITFGHKFQTQFYPQTTCSPHIRLVYSGTVSLCHLYPAFSVPLQHCVSQHDSPTLFPSPTSPGIWWHLQPSHQHWCGRFKYNQICFDWGLISLESDSRVHARKHYSTLPLRGSLGLAQHNSSPQLKLPQSLPICEPIS